MKEFIAETGGRYVFADDFKNLQELALAFSSIFDGCDNFIISGCKVTSNSISEGYVYINGKIRFFSGSNNVTTWPCYLKETTTIESVSYVSGPSKTGRKVYGCELVTAQPSQIDSVIGKVPAFITMKSNVGGLQLKDAFIGKYALQLSPLADIQTVNSKVKFSGAINADSGATIKRQVTISDGIAQADVICDISRFDIVLSGTENNHKLRITTDNGLELYKGDALIAKLNSSRASFMYPVYSHAGIFGSAAMKDNNVYNTGEDTTAALNINMVGYQGGVSQYRNTLIGDGKKNAIIDITGATKSIAMNGPINVKAGQIDALVLKSAQPYSDQTLVNAISWKDKDEKKLATIGFITSSDKNFSVKCDESDIIVRGKSWVDLGPEIREGGKPLSNKYALQTELTKKVSQTDYNSKIAELEGRFSKDTGWITILPEGEFGGLYGRQIGNIVSIQGVIKYAGDRLFVLPETLGVPTYHVGAPIVLGHNPSQLIYGSWRIKAGERVCEFSNAYGFNTSHYFDFSTTYMTGGKVVK